jgi:hypothetical protein
MDIRNEAQLRKFLMDKCVEAVSNAEKKVNKELDDNLNRFYSEFEPERYVRTNNLLNSLESTGVIQSEGGVDAEVGFATPHYKKGWIPLQDHGYGLACWSDEKILNTVMTGGKSGLPHGGYEDGTAIWTQSMENLGGRKGIESLIKQELKKQGL